MEMCREELGERSWELVQSRSGRGMDELLWFGEERSRKSDGEGTESHENNERISARSDDTIRSPGLDRLSITGKLKPETGAKDGAFKSETCGSAPLPCISASFAVPPQRDTYQHGSYPRYLHFAQILEGDEEHSWMSEDIHLI